MELRWDVDKEYGFLDIVPRKYDEEYFKKYSGYDNTPMGNALTQARINFVDKWHYDKLLDVGVGGGKFLKTRQNTMGYDINEAAIKMLKDIGRYIDIQDSVFSAYSFFDSFEHIRDHSNLLNSMYPKTKIFMSIPIFHDISHTLRSKHFRPDEHFWYFTTQGLIRYMADYGFCCLDVDNFETRAGREDILSFVFEKR
jgi:hypothetical protein